MRWNEQVSRDFEGSKAFYAAVFGYEYADMSGDGFSYATFKVDGRDVGGIGGPVTGGQALPGDGGTGADAEGPGEDGGGDLGGELEQCRAAGLAGADPERVQPLGESRSADRLAGLPAGEQPG